MAWTTPMTAVANEVFTATQFNTHVRDNLLETAPAKATEAGGFITTAGANSVKQSTPLEDFVETDESASSGFNTFVDLATVGPEVTVDTGTSAWVFFSCEMNPDSTDSAANMSVEVSGATSISPNQDFSARLDGVTGGNSSTGCNFRLFTALNEGTNTFTAKYSSFGASFRHRRLMVVPL